MRRNLSYYCLLAPRTYIFLLHAHPVCGESHNQRNTIGEVATVGWKRFEQQNIPSKAFAAVSKINTIGPPEITWFE